MSRKWAEFGTCFDANLLFGVCFKTGRADVGAPDVKSVEFTQEHEEPEATEGDDSRVDAIDWDICEVAISDQPGTVPTIMLNVTHWAHSDVLVTIWNRSVKS